ncbi:MAG: 2-phospho-L-lactate guanylyltransferase [Bryobacteraceae bacterium]
MIFALLPVKAPRNSKQRLSGILTASEREALARCLFEQTLETVLAARNIDRLCVVTSDSITAGHARCAGALVFDELEQRSHSHSADTAARRAIELGARTVVMLPIDVPLLTVAEVEQLAAAARPGVLIVPDAAGTGTNALVRTPPDIIESRFGPNSLRAHLEEARLRGVPADVMRPPGLLFDIDTPEDVTELLLRAPECRAARLLAVKCTSGS